jgi:hypothetical protein
MQKYVTHSQYFKLFKYTKGISINRLIVLCSLHLETTEPSSIYFEYEIPLSFILPNHHLISEVHARWIDADNTMKWEYRIEVDNENLNIVPILTKAQYYFDTFYGI